MCEALRELFADDLRESELRGRNAGKIESVIQQTVKKYKKVYCGIDFQRYQHI